MKKYFRSMSHQMTAEVRSIQQALQHPGMKGDAGEQVVRNFLLKYLPKRYGIYQGKVTDFTGQESKQTDIIIVDVATTVPLYIDQTNIVVPIESVYAVIEVKTSLTVKALRDGIANVDALHKLKMPRTFQPVRGGVLVKESKFDLRPKGMVIGLNRETSASIEILAQSYLKHVRSQGISFPLISSCVVLGDGYFFDVLSDNKSRSGSNLYVQKAGEDALIGFFLTLMRTLEEMPRREVPSFEVYFEGEQSVFSFPDEDEPLAIGDRLRATRRAMSLTQVGLARHLGIELLDVIQFETKQWDPTGDSLVKIQRFLDDHDLTEAERPL